MARRVLAFLPAHTRFTLHLPKNQNLIQPHTPNRRSGQWVCA